MVGRSQNDPITARVMATGTARYFSEVSATDTVTARAQLLHTAERLETFLSNEGRGSDLDGILDDLDVAGLRTSANWIEESIQLRGRDFLELVDIARHINVPPIGESEAVIQSRAEKQIRAFIEEKKI